MAFVAQAATITVMRACTLPEAIAAANTDAATATDEHLGEVVGLAGELTPDASRTATLPMLYSRKMRARWSPPSRSQERIVWGECGGGKHLHRCGQCPYNLPKTEQLQQTGMNIFLPRIGN